MQTQITMKYANKNKQVVSGRSIKFGRTNFICKGKKCLVMRKHSELVDILGAVMKRVLRAQHNELDTSPLLHLTFGGKIQVTKIDHKDAIANEVKVR